MSRKRFFGERSESAAETAVKAEVPALPVMPAAVEAKPIQAPAGTVFMRCRPGGDSFFAFSVVGGMVYRADSLGRFAVMVEHIGAAEIVGAERF